MEASNAGMYDGSTAAAEAALMACRITKRNKVAVLATVNPKYREVMNTYLSAQDIALTEIGPNQDTLSKDHACVLVQSPNSFGCFEDMGAWANKVHDSGALFIIIFDPISLGMFKPPGEYGADIAVAEGQSLGSPLNFGGPGLGIFTCRQEYLRQMPGRVVGRTSDTEGQPGYVLTMATREQHIRRERATSNICTNEALVALAAAAYLAVMGRNGLRHVAELCYHKAHYAAQAISSLKGYSLAFPQSFFKEFAVHCPAPPNKINQALIKEKIIGGLDISHLVANGLLLCVTETNTREQIDRLIKALGEF
jgi:glycine dehydrogenase subunit 1